MARTTPRLVRSPLGACYDPATLPAFAVQHAAAVASATNPATQYAHARTLADIAATLAARLSPAFAAAPANPGFSCAQCGRGFDCGDECRCID